MDPTSVPAPSKGSSSRRFNATFPASFHLPTGEPRHSPRHIGGPRERGHPSNDHQNGCER